MLTPVDFAVTRATLTGADLRKSGYGNLTSGAGRRLRRVIEMFKEGPRYGDNPAKPGGEGWLVNAQQQKVVQFKPDASTVHAEWVAVRTYSWVPPNPPVPLTRRRMLRHNAIEAWNTMKKTGWRPCHPPVR